jgi:hypothetical protein
MVSKNIPSGNPGAHCSHFIVRIKQSGTAVVTTGKFGNAVFGHFTQRVFRTFADGQIAE